MKFLLKFACVFLLVPLTSCFEILEEVNLNQDGSGTFTITANFSESKGQLDKLMQQDSILNHKIPNKSEIENSLTELQTRLGQMDGISNVLISKDFTNYIFKLKCNFKDMVALNKAINKIGATYDKSFQESIHYSFSKGTFNKHFDAGIINKKDQLGSKEKEILAEARYTMIYRFDSEITSFSNSTAMLSKSKKAIILKSNLLPVITGEKNISNQIKLKQ